MMLYLTNLSTNKMFLSFRSVKYMCALAASKWIVTFGWVKQSLQTKEIVNEVNYYIIFLILLTSIFTQLSTTGHRPLKASSSSGSLSVIIEMNECKHCRYLS